jgi:hypothetical protein
MLQVAPDEAKLLVHLFDLDKQLPLLLIGISLPQHASLPCRALRSSLSLQEFRGDIP